VIADQPSFAPSRLQSPRPDASDRESEHSDQEAPQTAELASLRTFLRSPGGIHYEVDRDTRKIKVGQNWFFQNDFAKGLGTFKKGIERDLGQQISQAGISRLISGLQDESKHWKRVGPAFPPSGSRKEKRTRQTAQAERVIFGSPTDGSTNEYEQRVGEQDDPFAQRIMQEREEEKRERIKLDARDIVDARRRGSDVRGFPNRTPSVVLKQEKYSGERSNWRSKKNESGSDDDE
jgi:hypothetical protein